MLVLSRKVGQQIRLGEGIVLTVVDLKGGRLRIGIDAPREVAIARQEILPRVNRLPQPAPVPAAGTPWLAVED